MKLSLLMFFFIASASVFAGDNSAWSCSAYCAFKSYSSGELRLSGPKTADGETAGKAFTEVDKLCREEEETSGLHLDYYVGLVQSSEFGKLVTATFLNSCIH